MVTTRLQSEPARREEQGFALILALFTLLLLTSILGVLGTSIQIQNEQLVREGRRIRADALADAALAETLAGLARSSNFRGVSGRELNGGWIRSEVRRHGRLASVLVEAELGPAKRRIAVDVELVKGRPRVLGWRVVLGD